MRSRQGKRHFGQAARVSGPGIGLLFWIGCALSGLVDAAVYRCPDGSGGVLFQQQPCPQGEEVELDIRTTRWVASPPLDLSDRRPARAGGGERAALARVARAERKQKQACWRARQRIERIETELRRGYKPARGERLRQQRREQSDYLREFCR